MRDPIDKLEEANRQVEQAHRNVMCQEQLVREKRARGQYTDFAEDALRIYEESLDIAIRNRATVNGDLARLQRAESLRVTCWLSGAAPPKRNLDGGPPLQCRALPGQALHPTIVIGSD
jgi:hypothetical protein